jgi:hypothetical protein
VDPSVWLSKFTTISDPLSGTTGYVGYFWVDAEIRREVLEAQRGNKAYPPRVFRDQTHKQ